MPTSFFGSSNLKAGAGTQTLDPGTYYGWVYDRIWEYESTVFRPNNGGRRPDRGEWITIAMATARLSSADAGNLRRQIENFIGFVRYLGMPGSGQQRGPNRDEFIQLAAYAAVTIPAAIPTPTPTPTPAPVTITICGQQKTWDQIDAALRARGWTGIYDHAEAETIGYTSLVCPPQPPPSPTPTPTPAPTPTPTPTPGTPPGGIPSPGGQKLSPTLLLIGAVGAYLALRKLF